MTDRDFIKCAIAGSAIGGIVGGLLLTAFVFAMGGTFGQRCRAAGYDGAALERCVGRASNGGPIYEENIGDPAHD